MDGEGRKDPGEIRLNRMDAAWKEDCFLAEAETETADGELRYALVTDNGTQRRYRVMTESQYDAVFCRTDGFRPGPEHVLEQYESLRQAGAAGCPWTVILGKLDDLADVKDRILEYTWLPDDDTV